MKKLLTLAIILAIAVFLSGCQNSDNSNSSSSEQDNENSIVRVDRGAAPEMNSERRGRRRMEDESGEEEDDAGGGDDEEDDVGCGDDEEDDVGCGDDEEDDAGCGDDEEDDAGGDEDDDGDGGEGEGGGSVPQYEEGTAGHAVIQTWTAITNGEQTGLAAFISLRAKGDLAALRDGKLSVERLAELKQQMAQIEMLRPRTSGSSRTISFWNKEGRIFRFTCRKEDGKYVIRQFVNKEPSKRKRKRRNKY